MSHAPRARYLNPDVVTQMFGCSLATSAEEGNSMISRKGVMN